MSSSTFKKCPCAACGVPCLVFFGNRDGYSYYRCRACGSLQLLPLPDASELTDAYKNTYAGSGHCQAAPEKRNIAAQPQFEGIVSALLAQTNPALVLDYGPGWGGLLDALHAHNITAEGSELSKDMADYCEDRGYKIYHGSMEQIPGAGRYDAILMSSVFEHLVAHAHWFEEARRLLKTNGLIISLQPTAAFAAVMGTLFRFGSTRRPLPQLHQVFWPPWHVVLFSLKGMVAIAEQNGFELVEIRPAPIQREEGLTGLLQRILSFVNTIGVACFGVKWPLLVGHIFVFRKRGEIAG